MTNIVSLPTVNIAASASQEGDLFIQLAFLDNSAAIDCTGIVFSMTLHPMLATGLEDSVTVLLSGASNGQYLTNSGTTGVLTIFVPAAQWSLIAPGSYVMELTAVGDQYNFVIGEIALTQTATGPSIVTSMTSTARNAATATVSYIPGPGWNQYKGDWSSTVNYVPNDVVSYGVSSFIALEGNINQTPAVGQYWNYVALGLDPSALNSAVTAAAASATQAGTYESEASSALASASSSATSAAASAATATTEASAATTSATAAAVSASSAAASAATATTEASAATTSATNAAASASSAASSASTASTAATNTSAILASFRGVFLGAFASDSAATTFASANSITIAAGLMYENTTEDKFRIYSGSAWGDYDATAQASQTAAALSATNAAASASTASSAATTATTEASAASTSASNAATSATNAAASATTATAEAGAASTSASNAASSAAAASSSASSAASSASSAAAAVSGFLAGNNTWTGNNVFDENFTVYGTAVFDGVVASEGSSAGFNAYDRSSSGQASFYRSGGITYLYDSVYGNVLGFNTSGQVTIYEGLTVDGTAFCTGASASFLTGDRTSSGYAQFFRSGGISYLVDSTFGSVVSYNTSGLWTFLGAAALTTAPLLSDNSLSIPSTSWVNTAISNAVSGSGSTSMQKRQTVAKGPASSGAPSYMPSTASGLSITTTGVSSGSPLIIGAANGFSAHGSVDVIISITSNLTFSSLTASTTNYLFVNASTGATSASTLQPIYQFGGTISTANGQFTFDYEAMIGYLGNGTTAVATPLVCVGECVTGTSTVTSAVAYAYNGYYDSGYTSGLAGSATVKSHNIGIVPETTRFVLKNLTAEQGYSVGDVIANGASAASGNYGVFSLVLARNSITMPPMSGIMTVCNKSSGSVVAITAGNWAWKAVVDRGW